MDEQSAAHHVGVIDGSVVARCTKVRRTTMLNWIMLWIHPEGTCQGVLVMSGSTTFPRHPMLNARQARQKVWPRDLLNTLAGDCDCSQSRISRLANVVTIHELKWSPVKLILVRRLVLRRQSASQ